MADGDDLKKGEDLDAADQLKTVRLSTDEIRDSVEQERSEAAEVTRLIPTAQDVTAASDGAAPHDGRFGERFDDELSVSGVVWVTVGVVAVTLIFFVGSWLFYRGLIDAEKAATPAPTPVRAADTERRLPSGPRLQSSPEEELVELRREMHQATHGYGWVDEGAGVVYIPIDKAMDLVLVRGLASPGTSPATVSPADVPEEPSADEGDSP